MSSPLRIVFFGTPEFAVPSLDILIQNKYDVTGVITSPDKPAGRGLKLQSSAIKEYAVEHNLKILQPSNLKDEGFLAELKQQNADLQIVVAFRVLPEAVWKMPRFGTINLHSSLLPQYRGAAPINWAIINGERETGVSTFILRQEIDTGAILFQERTAIREKETAGELHDRLKTFGASLVLKTVQAIERHSTHPIEQDKLINVTELKSAPKLTKENTRIDPQKTAREIFNQVRGLSPYPGAHGEFFHKSSGLSLTVKIFAADADDSHHLIKPGIIETDNKTFIRVYFSSGFLTIHELQIAGKNRMLVKDFLNGFKFEGEWKLR